MAFCEECGTETTAESLNYLGVCGGCRGHDVSEPVDADVSIGSRVKCVAEAYLLKLYGKVGTVIVSHSNRRKVLFDCDRQAGDISKGQNLALAYWFYVDELEVVDEEGRK